MFSLFISEMKFSFDGIKISVRNLYTEKLYTGRVCRKVFLSFEK